MAEEKKQEVKPKKGLVHAHELYEAKGDSLTRKRLSCPKCGPGYFMAKHGNRTTCGNCGYCEFSSKKKEEKK